MFIVNNKPLIKRRQTVEAGMDSGHMPPVQGDPAAKGNPQAIAAAFRAARETCTPLRDFPGTLPTTLAEAYRIQDAAIHAFPDRVVGWKIAGIAPEWRPILGEKRLAGPVMHSQVRHAAQGGEVTFPVFGGGFAAVEAEFIFRIGRDVPADAAADPARLKACIGALHAGVETAGSPFAGINELGPCSVVSDFGNNSGIVVGPAIEGWQDERWENLTSRCAINQVPAGEGHAGKVMDGPLAALAFLVGNLAARGRSLRAGDYVSTGMTTGIHNVVAGDVASFEFAGGITFSARAVPARPQ